MEQFTVETRKGLQVSETTAKFVDAMVFYDQFRDKFLTALYDLYGEKHGDALYNSEEYQRPLEAVEKIVFEGLGLSVRDNLDVVRQPNTI